MNIPNLGFRLSIVLASALLPLTFSAEKADAPRPKLQILNGSSQPVDIFWLKSDSERVTNGSVAPGKDTIITTTIGHRFLLVGQQDKSEATVTSAVPVQGFRFDPPGRDGVPAFYTQQIKAHGFPIVASDKVNPYALREAAFLVDMMLAKRPDVREAMIQSGARMCIMAHDEYTTDLPEFARMAGEKVKQFQGLTAKDYWDARARGLGGSETDPFCSVAEENLLGFPGDPYAAECILIHEFAHNIHLRGLVNVDPTFDTRLQATYDAAMKAGLWKGKYAAVNHHEYFAEGVQTWFDDNRVNDHDHNHVHLRSQLIEYDPGLAAICQEVFGDTELKYTKPATRLTGHMAGYDPAEAPTFVWPERLKQAKVEIRAAAEARNKAANPLGIKTGNNATKPLKVFILAGQSNMEGHAKVETFDYLGDDPATAPLLKKMRHANGTPHVCEHVWISYLTGSGKTNGEDFGKLTTGYGARRNPTENGGKIGPEFTFGITMDEAFEEPVLIIKTAWGGKSLFYDYRPPSAGVYPRSEQDVAQDRNTEAGSGLYYRLMTAHVKTVLGNIPRVCPEYDDQGYEIAGFVWFQGFNDLVNREVYPPVPQGSQENRFAKYSVWMADFIRDVRRDLEAPKMPFVIGVLGVDGKNAQEDNLRFREAMAAPAALPEFRGNVVAVQTREFWDEPLGAIQEKRERVNQMAYLLRTKNKNHANKDGTMSEADQKAFLKEFEAELISPAEAALFQRGASNAGYHYLGCAKTFARMGQAFAEALLTIRKGQAE